MDAVVAVLTRAREMVRAGWVQGTGYVEGPDGTMRCAGQAIQDAFMEVSGARPGGCMCGDCPNPGGEVFNNVMRAYQDTIQNPNIPHWNDTVGRTQTEVIHAFDMTIARLSGPKIEVPRFITIPEKIEATWKPITYVTEPTVAPVLVEEEAPRSGVKKVLDLLGV